MTLELIMNADGAIDHDIGSPVIGGVFVIESQPSQKSRAESVGIYRGDLSFSFSGGIAGSVVNLATVPGAPGTISPTATKDKDGGDAVIRIGDTGTMTCNGTDASGATVTLQDLPVKVVDAGQSTVRGR